MLSPHLLQKNRQKVANKISAKSCVIVHSGYEISRSADSVYDFVVNRNFYYLTGINQPDVKLVMVKRLDQVDSYLFIDQHDPVMAKWIGNKLTIAEASQISGIKENSIYYNNQFDKFILNLFVSMRYSEGAVNNLWLDLEQNGLPLYQNYGLDFAKKVQKDFPSIAIKNIYREIVECRMVKDQEELDLIKQSINNTQSAIENVFQNTNRINNECMVDAYMNFINSSVAKGTSFSRIVASGKNATVLHYVANNQPINNDDLVLIDTGCNTANYASDISRTFPISGKFSQRQKEVYEVVLNCNKKCIEYAKAGVSWEDLNKYATDLLAQGCIELGLITDPADVRNYYYHSIGHSLGLDVHDPSLREKGLVEGMVITIEPGLYIEEEQIGIRIEDDIVITNDQAIVLSDGIIKEVDDIENYISKYNK